MTDIITEDTVLPTPIEPTISGLVDPPEAAAAAVEPEVPVFSHDGEKAQLIQNCEHAFEQAIKWVLGNVPDNHIREDALWSVSEGAHFAVSAILVG